MITVGSLFSGIGGLDLGLERAGMTVKWQSEIQPYSCRVLKKHWPDVPNLGDIKNIDWENVEVVDVIAGGYPCQPFSTAGKRNGTDDPRHLWPYFRNAISRIRPRIALLENVPGHLSMGASAVIGDLAKIGYDCEWATISAASVGAAHKRERLFIIAYPDQRSMEFSHQRGISPESVTTGRKILQPFNASSSNNGATHSDWFSKSGVGRIANGVPHRMDRLTGLGNAVVPQVAELVGRMIMASLT